MLVEFDDVVTNFQTFALFKVTRLYRVILVVELNDVLVAEIESCRKAERRRFEGEVVQEQLGVSEVQLACHLGSTVIIMAFVMHIRLDGQGEERIASSDLEELTNRCSQVNTDTRGTQGKPCRQMVEVTQILGLFLSLYRCSCQEQSREQK